MQDLGEACAYLRDPILRARYEEIVAAVSEQLARGIRVEDLMGSQIDALKLVSSLTLFRAAAEQLGREDPVYASSRNAWQRCSGKPASKVIPVRFHARPDRNTDPFTANHSRARE